MESMHEEQSGGKKFVAKELFRNEVPSSVRELRERLIKISQNLPESFIKKQNDHTDPNMFDFLGSHEEVIPLAEVIGWIYFNSVIDFLDEERSDSRGLEKIFKIIKGWSGDDGEEEHRFITSKGLEFVSSTPHEFVLVAGKHRYMAALAMGIDLLPGKVDTYCLKNEP